MLPCCNIKWPKEFDSSRDNRAFEGLARNLRYQALGRACRDAKATGILMAHHADDQAETIIMRIADPVEYDLDYKPCTIHTGYPNAMDRYGIYRSGQKQKLRHKSGYSISLSNKEACVFFDLCWSFDKPRLIATCEEKRRGMV